MGKTSFKVVHSFLNRKPKCITNTSTDGTSLFLFGNKIAEWKNNELWITNAGWFSITTKDRLNSLPGVSWTTNKKVHYLNGNLWDGEWTKIEKI